MKNILITALAALSFMLSGCVSVSEGTSQNIKVVTNPVAASCVFERHGEAVGNIDNTPGTLAVRKSKYDITMTCKKPGYREASYLIHSGTSPTIVASIGADLMLTGGLSSIVDSADGADNRYDSIVSIFLIPDSNPQPIAATTTNGQ